MLNSYITSMLQNKIKAIFKVYKLKPTCKLMLTQWKFLLCLFILCLLVISCNLKSFNNKEKQLNNNQKTKNEAVLVTVAQAKSVLVSKAIEITGSLHPLQETVISSLTDGVVIGIPYEIGDKVIANQILARLDNENYKLQLAKEKHALEEIRAKLGLNGIPPFPADKISENNAKSKYSKDIVIENVPDVRQTRANLDQARLDMERAEKLAKDGLMPEQNLETARTRYKVTLAAYQAAKENVLVLAATLEGKYASLELAKKRLRETVVKSPFQGEIKERFVSPGEYVKTGAPLLALVINNPIKLQMEIPERFAGQITPGRPIKVNFDALPGYIISGSIKRIAPQVSSLSRSYIAEAILANHDNRLKPGFFARVKVITAPSAAIVIVPENAILTISGTNKVFVIENNAVYARIVNLGESHKGNREVLDGIKSGEIVATSNLGSLYNGCTVKLNNQ